MKKVESLKEIERNNKGFGEMDKIDSIKKFSDEVFEYFICIIIKYNDP